jgi:glycosyltransferase involved in cell wall biosynthesis
MNSSLHRYTICIVYPYVMHYRLPVFKELTKDTDLRFVFAAGEDPENRSVRSIPVDTLPDHIALKNYGYRGFTIQFGLLSHILARDFDAMVFLSNPNILTNWVYSAVARLLGIKVLFWTHGWLAHRLGHKERLRDLFYRLAHHLLLYEQRAKEIGIQHGFNPKKMTVIYNSLDHDAQKCIYSYCANHHPSELNEGPQALGKGEIYFCCVARLTSQCRFDILIKAVSELKKRTGRCYPVVLVGTGPEREALIRLAEHLGVKLILTGETYDETLIGSIIYHSRAVVSPGKVGLTAIHGLAFGTPVITHDDFDTQGPEHAVIRPGETGSFFHKDDLQDLADVLSQYAASPRSANEREMCKAVVENKYNPKNQARLIRQSILSTIEGHD